MAFAELQSLPTNRAHDMEIFTLGTKSYLTIADAHNGSSSNLNSRAYLWDGSTFTEEALLPAQSVYDFQAFTIANTVYLAVANGYNGFTRNINSVVYRPEWE